MTVVIWWLLPSGGSFAGIHSSDLITFLLISPSDNWSLGFNIFFPLKILTPFIVLLSCHLMPLSLTTHSFSLTSKPLSFLWLFLWSIMTSYVLSSVSLRSQMTCLMLAAKGGYSKIINLLVSHGAKIDIQDSNGYTVCFSYFSSIEYSSHI